MGPLDGQVALVTGAGRSRGMGRAIALRLAAAGADVAVADIARAAPALDVILDDAVRHRVGVKPQYVLYAAASWGHDLYATGIDDLDLGAPSLSATRERDPSDGGGAGAGRSDVREAEQARHRLRRHARDLAARHEPTAGWPQPLRRPAVHANTPDGWQAACPI